MTFDKIVGLTDGLSLPQKESLVEILSKRLVEERRMALRKDIRDANREFKVGKCRAVTPAKLTGVLTGSWACSAGYDLRVIFKLVKHAIILQSIGTHDEVY